MTGFLPPGVLFDFLGIKGAVELIASPTGRKDGQDCSPTAEQDESTSESVKGFLVPQKATKDAKSRRSAIGKNKSSCQSCSQVGSEPVTGAGDRIGQSDDGS